MIEKIVSLSAKLPSGKIDPMSVSKLLDELSEFQGAMSSGDDGAVLHELADVIYYCVKIMSLNAYIANVSLEDGMKACIAKYTLRAADGNPKDINAEIAAIKEAISEGHYTE